MYTSRMSAVKRGVTLLLIAGVLAALAGAGVVQAGTVGAPAAPRSAAADEPGAGRVPIGISTGFSIYTRPQALEDDVARMSSLGVRRIRVDISWPAVQPTESGALNWAPVDSVVGAARARGMHVLAVIGYVPDWALRGPAGDRHPSPELFGNFVRAAANRYANDVLAWEIWNEPNQKANWNGAAGGGPDPAVYAELVGAASRRIKAVNDSATVVVGAFAPLAQNPPQSLSPQVFLERFYDRVRATGGDGIDLRDFDAVSTHPYTYSKPVYYADGHESYSEWAVKIPELRAEMVENGDSAKRIWITEYGAPTGPAECERSVSARVQSDMVTRAIAEARSRSYIGPLYVYSLRDRGGVSPGEECIEQFFGLFRADGDEKAGATDLRAYIRQNG